MVRLQTNFIPILVVHTISYLHSNKWLDYKPKTSFEKLEDTINLHSNKWLDYKLVDPKKSTYIFS